MPFSQPFPKITFPVEHAQKGTVELELREATTEDANTFARTWKSTLDQHQRDDGNWEWAEHLQRAQGDPSFLCLAVTHDNELDAMTSLKWDRAASRLVPGHDMLYIEYVGVAPWHQSPPVGQRLIRGLGLLLVRTTVQLSFDLKLDGHVGLHAKPDVETFYRKIGMVEGEREQLPDGTWLYFEVGPAEANALLGRR